MFARIDSKDELHGSVGKLLEHNGDHYEIEFFDAPYLDTIVQEIHCQHVEAIVLPEQTRVYYFNPDITVWESGRVLEDFDENLMVSFPNKITRNLDAHEVNVRWSKPIGDPTNYLAAFVSETPYIFEKRSEFVKSAIQQRAVTMGMSALLSSAIELEAHQIEVVRRILQDPVQRYLLADEVGLGKTIEAGILIRQCMIDCNGQSNILVIVPDAIVQQWQSELESKFFLGEYLNNQINVIPFANFDKIQSLIESTSMLIIDEAHLLTDWQSEKYSQLYDCIASNAPNIERIILLSATPVLHNEIGFLKMLHILDPGTYSLEDEEGFQLRIKNRQPLAEITARLSPEHRYFIDEDLIRLSELFSEDRVLQEHVSNLQSVLSELTEEDDQRLIDAMGNVKVHISEVYRLHRRILRNRRSNILGLTPERAGATLISYNCSNTSEIYDLIENWRLDTISSSEKDSIPDDLFKSFAKVIEFIGSYSSFESEVSCFLTELGMPIFENVNLNGMAKKLQNEDIIQLRVENLTEVIASNLSNSQQFIVFCTTSKSADYVANHLSQTLSVPVDRHNWQDDNWKAFNADSTRKVLVCDSSAEVGLNLQGREKTIVHFDLPLNPNQLEQRIGRLDRFGSGKSIQSIVMVCEENQYERYWFEYLDKSLKIFDESVAKLQYSIDDAMQGLQKSLLCEGVEAIIELEARSSGEEGLIQHEINEIDAQDTLDSLGMPKLEVSEKIELLDSESGFLQASALNWIEGCLIFGQNTVKRDPKINYQKDPPFHFQYLTGNKHTLIPLETFILQCPSVIDMTTEAKLSKKVRTYPVTFKRTIANGSEGRYNNTRLLRYGEEFTDGMWNISQIDDRGRSSAVMKYIPDYQNEGFADLFFRFDFLVEANIESALKILEEFDISNLSSKAALHRRGDMALPPLFQTVWLDYELKLLSNSKVIEKLDRPYQKTQNDLGEFDINIFPAIWKNLINSDIPEMADWRSLCLKAKDKAKAELQISQVFVELLKNANNQAKEVERARLSQLRVRSEQTKLGSDIRELEMESKLSVAILEGIQDPIIKVDAICAYFVTGKLDLLKKIRNSP